MTKLELINQFDLEPDLHKEVRLAVFAHALPLAGGDVADPVTRLAKSIINNWPAYQERFCGALCVEFISDADNMERKKAADDTDMHVGIAEDAMTAAVAKWFSAFA